MTYRREISFPINPTKADIKNLKRQVAKDRFKVVDGDQKNNPRGRGDRDGGGFHKA